MFRPGNGAKRILAVLLTAFIALAISTAPVLAEEDKAVQEGGLKEEMLEEKAITKEEGLKEEELMEERKLGLGFFFPAAVVMPVEIGTSELDRYPELSIGLKFLLGDAIGIEPLFLFKYTSADLQYTHPEEKQLGLGLGCKLYYNLVHNERVDFYLAGGAVGTYGSKTAETVAEREISVSSLDFFFMGYLGAEAFFFRSIPRLGLTLELALPVATYYSETYESTPKGEDATKNEEEFWGFFLNSVALNFGIHYYFK
jgi:hypothetical protein